MANEPQFSGIKDIANGAKDLNIVFIVLDIGNVTVTKDSNRVRSCKVADKTGSINVSIWGDAGDVLQTGDICRLTKGYAKSWKGQLTLYSSARGFIHKIGEFCMQFSESPFLSEFNAELHKQEIRSKVDGPIHRKSPTDSSNPPTSGPVSGDGPRPAGQLQGNGRNNSNGGFPGSGDPRNAPRGDPRAAGPRAPMPGANPGPGQMQANRGKVNKPR